MTREPDDEEQSERPEDADRVARGGGAAERLRQFLAERFGNEAPPIPPDEDVPAEESTEGQPSGLPTEGAPTQPPNDEGPHDP
jgi:hypothetical protein